MKHNIILVILYVACLSRVFALEALYTKDKMNIDGNGNEAQWQQVPWLSLNNLILGEYPTSNDFQGKYKLLWDEESLYILVEFTDDVLYDQEKDPLKAYWDDDCLEIFIDEDASGGDHLYNHNAFAYHVALDGNVVDIEGKNLKGEPQPKLFNSHVINKRKQKINQDNTYQWELAVGVFSNKYTQNKPMKNYRSSLHLHKKIGFMLAYCDNDSSPHREHFINSVEIPPLKGDRNLGYKDASVFQKLTLVDSL